jgi:hypothetical protein
VIRARPTLLTSHSKKGDTITSQSIVVHEIGHWLGLMHTFEGDSCDPSNKGDYIDDTPQQLLAPTDVWGNCDMEMDSCPGLEGKDLVNNPMSEWFLPRALWCLYLRMLRLAVDYMDDACTTGLFTPGQVVRMHQWWDARKGALAKRPEER